MTDISSAQISSDEGRVSLLRRRIGWLCHMLRVAAAAYCLWMLYAIVTFWNDEALVVAHFGDPLKIDVAGVTGVQRLGAFGVSFVIWLLLTAACYSGWRLFSTYLEGRIFTPASSAWLRRLALFGLIAQLIDIAGRPLVSAILTAHKEAGHRAVAVFFRPEDLSTLLLLATLLALAQIQKTAADIADEHSQIV